MAFDYSRIPEGILKQLPFWPGSRGSEDDQQKKAEPGKKGEIARWNNHKFKVEKKSIHSLSGLQIKGHTETEDKVGSNQKFVSRKNSKPTEITLTAILDARLGCDVKTEALQFVADAYNGCVDWFYMGTSKLATYKLMLTDATVKDIVLSPKGKWISANVALTLKQCTQKNGSTAGVVDKSDSGDGHGGGGGGGSSGGGGGKKRTKGHRDKKEPDYDPSRKEGKSGHTSVPSWFDDDDKSQSDKAQDEIDKRHDQAQKGGGSSQQPVPAPKPGPA